ncbi:MULTISPECIES: DUF4136 domain-containing protein [Thalassospira]|uniref:DUF4136 domain-containing protein n=2 Tax=Thalassospira TaxID=168934 RepID=A0A367WBD2_9PROT|nr:MULTISPECIES: DUF4136 domain-containing protein [Thalassospira]MDG4718111.1 DUF4136 domain-containing protein [Thalassospira sp. FZY0004]RCK37881.1 hypothetical protein TH19_07595 [Thalassospira profundimaris]
MTQMKLVIAGVMVLMLSACAASGPRIYTDVDPGADFSQFYTFAFIEDAGKDTEAQYKTLSGQRIEDAISTALEARGYRVDIHNPDILINFHLKTEEKTRTSPPVYMGGYYGYRNGMYVGWPGYVEPGYVDSYTEGTLTVDMVNRATSQMVWEGTAVARVTSALREAPNETIRSAVASIFAQYPYVAGSGVAVPPVQ